jgi:hypothetical protein
MLWRLMGLVLVRLTPPIVSGLGAVNRAVGLMGEGISNGWGVVLVMGLGRGKVIEIGLGIGNGCGVAQRSGSGAGSVTATGEPTAGKETLGIEVGIP